MNINELRERVNGQSITNKGEIVVPFSIEKQAYKSGAYEVMNIVTAEPINGKTKHTVIVNKNITETIKEIKSEFGITDVELSTIPFVFKHIYKKKDGSDYYLLNIAE